MNDVFEGEHGWGHVHNGFAKSRQLSQQSDFDMGSRMAQIFSGCMFSALAVYMVFSNSTRLKVVQKQSFEKRLATCCQINTIVAAISAFLNFFQLTEVDNWALPGNTSYSVDVARPIEWILTCPLLQLSLVLMGGSKIPEYRRTAMPGFAYSLLVLGALTLFIEAPFNYIVYMFSCCIFCVMCFFNRQQILEASDGAEGLFQGDSEYRKCTIVLLLTWLPFPAWFMITPEGLGLIEDVVVIQMGWACLNIVAKFTMIFFIQRVKDNYWNRVKLTKELKLQAMLPDGQKIGDINVMDDDDDALERAVGEQMVFGGTYQQHQEKPAPTNSSKEMPGMIVPNGMMGAPTPAVHPSELGQTIMMNAMGGGPEMLEPLERKVEQMEARLMSMDSKFENMGAAMQKGFEAVLVRIETSTGSDITKQLEKSQESIREKMGSQMQDLGKLIEKANSMLEVKMEIAQAEQNTLCQKIAGDVKHQLEQYPEELFKRLLDTHENNTNSMETMQASMDVATKKLEDLQASQASVLSALSGSLTSMTDGWAQQIIQESKASAFTLQTKIGVMEQMHNKSQEELEQRITSSLETMVQKAMTGLKTGVVDQTLSSTEKLHATIEASAQVSLNEQSKLQQNLASQLKELGTDVSKHVEAGIGVFGNSLRAQLETLQQAQLAARMDSEASMGTKWDGLLGRLNQQSQKQVHETNDIIQNIVKDSMDKASKDQMNCVREMQAEMERIAKSQQDRQMDTHAVITSVLEQSCGAKTRAEDCANNLAILNAELRSPGGDGQRGRGRDDDDRYSDGGFNAQSQRPGTTGSGSGRPATAGGRGDSVGRNDRGGSSSYKQSKSAQYGIQVLNS